MLWQDRHCVTFERVRNARNRTDIWLDEREETQTNEHLSQAQCKHSG